MFRTILTTALVILTAACHPFAKVDTKVSAKSQEDSAVLVIRAEGPQIPSLISFSPQALPDRFRVEGYTFVRVPDDQLKDGLVRWAYRVRKWENIVVDPCFEDKKNLPVEIGYEAQAGKDGSIHIRSYVSAKNELCESTSTMALAMLHRLTGQALVEIGTETYRRQSEADLKKSWILNKKVPPAN